ncbi:hypothetical protein LIER_31325 [Lithospermum erythrorhizon]|uniref:Uncharacterized protein n=1 Tax=Lithospermum erythrorhizon TaxID=34254 RepID=A0AAV3RQK4_LITER
MGSKGYDVLVKAAYNPEEDKTMGQLPPEVTSPNQEGEQLLHIGGRRNICQGSEGRKMRVSLSKIGSNPNAHKENPKGISLSKSLKAEFMNKVIPQRRRSLEEIIDLGMYRYIYEETL